jgi:hypothetical protein
MLHLGFIIEDVQPSPAIDARGNGVDLCGYLSMAAATLRAQAAAIETLSGCGGPGPTARARSVLNPVPLAALRWTKFGPGAICITSAVLALVRVAKIPSAARSAE